MQSGEVIGSLPLPMVEPAGVYQVIIDGDDYSSAYKSDHYLTSVRRGDFVVKWFYTEGGWLNEARLVAPTAMGPGDFENIRGFKWARS